MIKKILLSGIMIGLTYCSFAQEKFYTKTGKISFYSKAPMEEIEAVNNTVTAVLDTKSGGFQFLVKMNGFAFEKALMQDHFHENYVESDKYPKAEFKGSIVNNADINYKKEGVYNAKVKGLLTIHGVTKEIETIGTIKVEGNKLKAESVFNILLSDYDVKIPTVVGEKISNNIKITANTNLEKLNG